MLDIRDKSRFQTSKTSPTFEVDKARLSSLQKGPSNALMTTITEPCNNTENDNSPFNK